MNVRLITVTCSVPLCKSIITAGRHRSFFTFDGCCYKTVEFATAASQKRFCITQLRFHIIVLFHDCSLIKDDSYKKSNVFFSSDYSWYSTKEKPISSISVLWCSRCKIHRFVAAEFEESQVGRSIEVQLKSTEVVQKPNLWTVNSKEESS